MTITYEQLSALSGYLQRIGFTGVILDPNDHDESVHQLADLLPSDPESPYIRVYSFKPATHPHVLNGGHLFTYGVTADSVDAIVASASPDGDEFPRLTMHQIEAIRAGVSALKPDGQFFFCTTGQLDVPYQRAMMVKVGVSYAGSTGSARSPILIGRKPGAR